MTTKPRYPLAPVSEVIDHEIAYWRAELALDTAMTQHMERILAHIRQTDELPAVKPAVAAELPRAGCLGWLLRVRGR